MKQIKIALSLSFETNLDDHQRTITVKKKKNEKRDLKKQENLAFKNFSVKNREKLRTTNYLPQPSQSGEPSHCGLPSILMKT